MVRRREQETEAINADSFLDIVASVVSILIILFMMTGVKIKNTPVDLAAGLSSAAAKTGVELAGDLAAERTMRQEVLKTARQVQEVQSEALLRQQERDMLATAVAAIQRETLGKKEQLSAKSQQDTELDRAILDARLRLSDLQSQRRTIESAPAAPLAIESYPTPLSHEVEGHEIHFQLRRGRLALIPLDKLIEDFKTDAQSKVSNLRDLPEMTETVGPEGGFRMRYSLERVDTPPEEALKTRHGGSYVRFKRWTLIPSSDDLGETLDEALRPDSRFHQVLGNPRTKDSTITIWVYPDSFDAFRVLRKELYRTGFPVAGRPLAEGKPIAGSPEGSKSTAE
jgi:hypothetical protein